MHAWDDVEEVYISTKVSFPSLILGNRADAVKLVLKTLVL